MSLNHLTSSTPIQEYLNIGCNDLKCNTLEVNGVPVSGGSLDYGTIYGPVSPFNIGLTASYQRASQSADNFSSSGTISPVTDGVDSGLRLEGAGVYRLEYHYVIDPGTGTPSILSTALEIDGVTSTDSISSDGISLRNTESGYFYYTAVNDDPIDVYIQIQCSIVTTATVLKWNLSAVKVS